MKPQLFLSLLSLSLVLLCLNLMPGNAQVPGITINPVWRPASELTTLDGDGDGVTGNRDDIRYVTVEIYATTTVEFWAVGFVCTVNKAVLESYVTGGDPNGTGDDTPMFTLGAAWPTGGDSVQQTVDTTDTDGKLSFAISVQGSSQPPIGSNGVARTLHLATLRYRVKEGLVAATSSAFSCMTRFLNRNGGTVLAASYVAPPALNILPGYTFTGKVTYQGTTIPLTAAQAIDVLCDDADGNTIFDDIVTTANISTGLFTVSNLRNMGRYDCQFFGNIRTVGTGSDLHLMGSTDFNLTSTSFALLPVVVKSGNVDTTTAGSESVVNTADITMVTSNWNAPLAVLTGPYMFGDATGDRKIDDADLALVASNIDNAEPTFAQHLIYSLPRDFNAFQNSHLWLGNVSEATVSQFVPGNTRDYWPAVSPNGARIAFIRDVGSGDTHKYALFTAPITNGVVGAATRITPAAATYDAFAPSWSPDGARIAFVCSYNQEWSTNPTIQSASGNLCLIDAGGQNFQLVLFNGTLFNIKIQAPAWLSTHQIYFAAKDVPLIPNCNNTICMINLSNNSLSSVGNNLGGPGSDMPYVRNNILGITLFYRKIAQGIRYAQVDASSGFPLASYPSIFPYLHNEALFFPNLGYFTVSTGADPDILFYESLPASNDPGGRQFLIRCFTGTAGAPTWSCNSFYNLANGVGNPAFDSGFNEALRNTVAYIP